MRIFFAERVWLSTLFLPRSISGQSDTYWVSGDALQRVKFLNFYSSLNVSERYNLDILPRFIIYSVEFQTIANFFQLISEKLRKIQ